MTESNDALIKIEDLHKVFVTEEVETHALSGVHLKIQEGEYVSIAGPSGCGKSTLLSIMGLLDSPTKGDYWLSNSPAAELTASQRACIRNREVGFIFQSFNLIGDLTVYENVELPLTYRCIPKAERQQCVRTALERVAIGLGAGASELTATVEAFQMTATGLRKLGGGELDAEGGKGPGGAVGAAVLIATHNPVGLIVSTGVKAYGEESGKSTIEGRADQTAKEIADQLKKKFEEQGWI